MKTKIRAQILSNKKIDFIENFEKEVEKFISIGQINYDREQQAITVWITFDKWIEEQDVFLKKIKTKYPNAYKGIDFIYIPIGIPSFEISDEEIYEELLSTLKSNEKHLKYVKKRNLEIKKELKNYEN